MPTLTDRVLLFCAFPFYAISAVAGFLAGTIATDWGINKFNEWSGFEENDDDEYGC